MKRQVRETQARADELKVKLGIPDVTTEANGLGRLESVRIEAEAAYQEVSSLHREPRQNVANRIAEGASNSCHRTLF